MKHFPPQNTSTRHTGRGMVYALLSPGWHWGRSCPVVPWWDVGHAHMLWQVSSSHHPFCLHWPVLLGALVLGTAEQDRKCSYLPVIPHVLFLTLAEQIPNSSPLAGQVLGLRPRPWEVKSFRVLFSRTAQLAVLLQTQAECILKTVLRF